MSGKRNMQLSAGKVQIQAESKQWKIFAELLQFFYFLCGVYGSQLGFTEIVQLQYSKRYFMWILPVLGCYLWWAFGKGKRRLVLAYLPAAAAFWLCLDILKEQSLVVMDRMIRQAEAVAGLGTGEALAISGSGEIWYATCFTGFIMLAVMLILLELIRAHRRFLLSFLFLTTPVLAGILLEKPPSFGTVCLLALFFTGSLSAGTFQKRAVFQPYGKQACCINGLLTGILVLTVSGLVYIGTEKNMDGMMNRANDWGHQILLRVTDSDMLRRNEERPQTGADGNMESGFWEDDGWINRNDQKQGGNKTCIQVQLTQKPEQLTYLKGFTGMEYSGWRWGKAEMSWKEQQQEEMRYHLLESEDQNNAAVLSRQVTVKEYREKGKYLPYFSKNTGRGESGILYSCYTLKDVKRLLKEQGAKLEDDGVYQNEILRKYMEVPAEDLPRLTQLCRSHPFGTQEEITAFIQKELAARASYTLTPGMAATEEDIVEYFLFEGKKGYCIHFATAAALMYRMYGIPARYVAGYLAQPENFTETSGGIYEASLTDAQAHAWVEIYDLNVGWMPVEVTPGQSVVAETGLRPEQEDRNLQDTPRPDETGQETEEQETEKPEKEQPVKENPEKPEKDAAPLPFIGVVGTGKTDAATGTQISVWLGVIFLVTAAVGILILLLLVRRKKLFHRQAADGVGTVFEQMLEVLHARGCLTGMSGQEPEFAECFARETEVLTANEIRTLLSVVQCAAFGREAPSSAAERWAVKSCRKVMESAGAGLPVSLKWKYRIWKSYF